MKHIKRTVIYGLFILIILGLASGRLFQIMRVQQLNRELIMACSRLDAAKARETLEAGASPDSVDYKMWQQPSLIDGAGMLFARTPQAPTYHASALQIAFETSRGDLSNGEQRLFPILHALLAHGASPDVRSRETRALVDEMSMYRCERCLALLLEHGAVPDEPGPCLARACDIGDIHIARLLLKRGASPNERVCISCTTSSTPLGYSISRNNSAMAAILLESGANPNQRLGSDEMTCLEFANFAHYSAIVALLKKHGAKQRQ